MPQVGPLELLVIATVALIVFGPEKLPQIARQIGRYATELRRMADEVKDEFESGLDIEDEEPDEDEDEDEEPEEPEEPDEPAVDKPDDPDESER